MKAIISGLLILLLVAMPQCAGSEEDPVALALLPLLFVPPSAGETLDFAGDEGEAAPAPAGAADSMDRIAVPVDFDFRVYRSFDFEVRVLDSAGRPYQGAGVRIVTHENDLLMGGSTDADGFFRGRVNTIFLRPLYVRVEAVGLPMDRKLLAPRTVISSRSDADALAGTGGAVAGSRAAIAFAAASGVPEDMEYRAFPQSFISDISAALPESKPVQDYHPEYLLNDVDTNLLVEEEADVWVSFIHEGAGYRNSFGYFTYQDGEPPASAAEVERRVVFANASYSGSGGSLETGDTVHLGRFQPGTRIGFWVVANGWNGSGIRDDRPVYYSLSEANPEADPELRKHLAVLWHEEEQRIVLGFEDLPRESAQCDHDFNDVVFVLESNPVTALDTDNIRNLPGRTDTDGDGVADNNDAFPNDPERAFRRYFPGRNSTVTLAYEDLFPVRGDYDFNDLVLSARFVETLDANFAV